VPFIELRDFDPDTQPDDYLQLARSDRFGETYPRRLAEYRAFLEENDVDASGLGAVASQAAPELTAEQAEQLDNRSIGDATRLLIRAHTAPNRRSLLQPTDLI
jgi:hypothetical protein